MCGRRLKEKEEKKQKQIVVDKKIAMKLEKTRLTELKVGDSHLRIDEFRCRINGRDDGIINNGPEK